MLASSARRPTSPARWLAIAGALVLCACAEVVRELREHTYPRDFEYLSDAELHSVMGQFAVQVRELDRLLARGEQGSEVPRERVIEHLRAMEQLARTLGSGEVRSNHPKLDEGIDSFRGRLSAARRAAEREPPNYYLAGTVSGACRYCHHP